MKLYDVKEPVIYPWWFGMMDFHYSHVASLRRKDPEYYESRLEMPEEYAAKGYCWPTIEDGKQILKFNPISWPTPKKPVSVKKMGKDISNWDTHGVSNLVESISRAWLLPRLLLGDMKLNKLKNS